MSHWSEKLDAYLARTTLSKKQLASELGISINTVEKWWRHREPSAENLTRIRKLLQEDAQTTITASDKSVTSSGEGTMNVESVTEARQTDEANFSEAPLGNRGTDFPAGLAVKEAVARQLPGKRERYEERPVVVSLLRSKCPFCEHDVAQFQSCPHCGQHFVWANIPVISSDTLCLPHPLSVHG